MSDSSSQGGSNPQSRPRPQVFISFRGDDVRNSFLRQVVTSLASQEINCFTDTRLPFGENLEELFTEIKMSKIAIVIFSKRFSYSNYCLEELSKIDKLAKKGKLKVIPVYYKVSQSDVKNLQGEFGESFERLKKKYKTVEPRNVLKWEASVKSIAKRKGLQSNINGSNVPLVRDIIREVKRELDMAANPGRTKMAIGEVFVSAFIAAFLFSLFMARLLFTDVKIFGTAKWLVGFPIITIILHQLYCAATKRNR